MLTDFFQKLSALVCQSALVCHTVIFLQVQRCSERGSDNPQNTWTNWVEQLYLREAQEICESAGMLAVSSNSLGASL